jgi:hypothetical protein
VPCYELFKQEIKQNSNNMQVWRHSAWSGLSPFPGPFPGIPRRFWPRLDSAETITARGTTVNQHGSHELLLRDDLTIVANVVDLVVQHHNITQEESANFQAAANRILASIYPDAPLAPTPPVTPEADQNY